MTDKKKNVDRLRYNYKEREREGGGGREREREIFNIQKERKTEREIE